MQRTWRGEKLRGRQCMQALLEMGDQGAFSAALNCLPRSEVNLARKSLSQPSKKSPQSAGMGKSSFETIRAKIGPGKNYQ